MLFGFLPRSVEGNGNMKTLSLLICGDRKWNKIEPIRREIKKLIKEYEILIVFEGDCDGADKLGGEIAEDEFGLFVDSNPAKWDMYGKAAGPIRNGEMLHKLLTKVQTDKYLVLAFHPDLRKSKGTKNMVYISRNAGVEVRVINK